MSEAKRFGNARVYKQVYNVLETFNGNKSLRFEEITYRFLKRFETAHLKKGNSINGLSNYMRTIRAIYNKAIGQNIVAREKYPFIQYKIKSEPTAKRAISIEKIRRILDLELETGTPLFHTRNYFLCSYLMNGISFIDITGISRQALEDESLIANDQLHPSAKRYSLWVQKMLPTVHKILSHEHISTH